MLFTKAAFDVQYQFYHWRNVLLDQMLFGLNVVAAVLQFKHAPRWRNSHISYLNANFIVVCLSFDFSTTDRQMPLIDAYVDNT